MPYTLRRPTLDDAKSILTLMCACDVAAIGKPDTTLDDVIDELRDPDIDLERDAWIAIDGDGHGAAVGCGLAFRQAESDMVRLDIYVHPEAEPFDAQLWQLLETRATEIVLELGHTSARVDVGLHRSDLRHREVAAARGYAPATAFYRMRIDHAGPVPAPEMPADLSVEVAGDDERLRRTAVDLDNAAFVEHYGFTELSYEWWAKKFESSPSNSWAFTNVLSVDGVPAAVLITNTQYVEDENCGYVASLGVLEEFRGRGLGRLLLLGAFAEDAALGRAGTILHVDANNLTPALGLYESVGMRQVLVIDSWRRTFTPGR